jgi:very-short-patch-repair endonuclease
MNKGNTEGTPEPGDSVETAREASVSKEQLQREYDQVGSLWKLGELHGISGKLARKLLIDHGIQIKPRGHRKGQKKSQAWREASAKHWNDPVWREEQRQRWLERLPSMRKGKGGSLAEKLLQEALKRAHVSFKANAVLLDGKYVADVLITQRPLIIEADGSSHWLSQAQIYDEQREVELVEAGYEIIRFSYEQLQADVYECVAQLNLDAETQPTFSVRSDAEAFGERINAKRDDPEWRAKWIANLSEAQRRRQERNRQMVIQSGLHEPCENMQRSAEMTDPLAPPPIDGDGSSER